MGILHILCANVPDEYGNYYAWGGTKTKSEYSWSTYKWCKDSDDTLTKYCSDSDYGAVDNKTVLAPGDDVAHVKLGGKWRMPTVPEWTELWENCTWTWTSLNGVDGRLVTGPNGNIIFLPAADYKDGIGIYYTGYECNYLSSSLYTDNPSYACGMYFDSNFVYWIGRNRDDGPSVRPVTE